jgi:hypothetical protein
VLLPGQIRNFNPVRSIDILGIHDHSQTTTPLSEVDLGTFSPGLEFECLLKKKWHNFCPVTQRKFISGIEGLRFDPFVKMAQRLQPPHGQKNYSGDRPFSPFYRVGPTNKKPHEDLFLSYGHSLPVDFYISTLGLPTIKLQLNIVMIPFLSSRHTINITYTTT